MKPFSEGEKMLMIMAAFAFDVLEIFLGLFTFKIFTLFSGLIAWVIFIPWFKSHGTTFIRKVKMGENGKAKFGAIKMSRVVSLVLESIPFIGFLPIFTFNVWSQINHVNKTLKKKEQNEKIVREKKPTRLEQKNARNN